MFLASAVDVEAIWWVAIIMSSLQGVHIFFAFGMNYRVRKLWRESSSDGKRAPVA